MKCFKCGADAPVGNNFCPNCGAPMAGGRSVGINGYNEPVMPKQTASGANVLAVCSMVLGILSFVFMVVGGVIQNSYEESMKDNYFSTLFSDEPEYSMAAIVMMVLWFLCSIAGLATSTNALRKKTTKKGIAITGLVCSSLWWIMLIILMIGVALTE